MSTSMPASAGVTRSETGRYGISSRDGRVRSGRSRLYAAAPREWIASRSDLEARQRGVYGACERSIIQRSSSAPIVAGWSCVRTVRRIANRARPSASILQWRPERWHSSCTRTIASGGLFRFDGVPDGRRRGRLSLGHTGARITGLGSRQDSTVGWGGSQYGSDAAPPRTHRLTAIATDVLPQSVAVPASDDAPEGGQRHRAGRLCS